MSSEQSAFIVYKSKYFNVVEGVRQGGVLSGLLYLVFIYDKLHGSEENNKIGIFNVTCCVSYLADDFLCLAVSPHRSVYAGHMYQYLAI